MIVSGLMSAFAKLEALATCMTAAALCVFTTGFCDTTVDWAQHPLCFRSSFSARLRVFLSCFLFIGNVITYNGVVTLPMGTGAENQVKACKYPR